MGCGSSTTIHVYPTITEGRGHTPTSPVTLDAHQGVVLGCAVASRSAGGQVMPLPLKVAPPPKKAAPRATTPTTPPYILLPQLERGAEVAVRRAAVLQRASVYAWAYVEPSVPPSIVAIPPQESPPGATEHLARMGERLLRTFGVVVYNRLAADVQQALFHDGMGGSDFAPYRAAMRGVDTDPGDKTYPPCSDPVAPLPDGAPQQRWMDDREFGWQRLNGVNPTLVRAVSAFPAKFPVGESKEAAAVLAARGEPPLRALLKAGRVLVNDYELLDGLITDYRRVHLAPLLCCYVDTAGHVMPLAIQLGQDPAEFGLWTPQDPQLWLAAKCHVQAAEAQQHEIVAHLTSTHLMMEATYVAANHTLSLRHPLLELLRPHFFFTIELNTFARESLINLTGPIQETFNVGAVGMVELLVKGCKGWDWKRYDIPLSMTRRGVGSGKSAGRTAAEAAADARLPEFYWRDDTVMIWEAVLRYTTDFVDVFYGADADVAADFELQAWIKVLTADRETLQGCGFVGLPGQGTAAAGCRSPGGVFTMATKADLARMLAMVIHNSSAGHAAVNNGQYDYMGYVPNMPVTFRLPVQRMEAARRGSTTGAAPLSVAEIAAAMPRGFDVLQQIAILEMLAMPAELDKAIRLLGDYDDGFFAPLQDKAQLAKVWAAVGAFKKGLEAVTAAIEARNQKAGIYRPYRYLLPSVMAQGISA